jgi:hypothetical protein
MKDVISADTVDALVAALDGKAPVALAIVNDVKRNPIAPAGGSGVPLFAPVLTKESHEKVTNALEELERRYGRSATFNGWQLHLLVAQWLMLSTH